MQCTVRCHPFPLAKGLFLRLEELPSSDSVQFAINVYLSDGNTNTFRFRSASVIMKSPELSHAVESPLGEFVLEMYRMPRKTFPPVGILEAPNGVPIPNAPPGYVVPQYNYESSLRFANVKPRQITLQLPPAEVSGRITEFPLVEFSLVEQIWVFSCLK